MSSRYHINPKTGNANICRAKFGNCPYEREDFAEHYGTKEDAQKAYEKQMENPVSEISRLIGIRGRAHQAIMEEFTKNDTSPFGDTEQAARVKLRNAIEDAIEKYNPTGVDDSGKLNNKPVKIRAPKVVHTDDSIIGFGNAVEEMINEQPELWDDMAKSGEQWIGNCSSDEAWSIFKYSCSSNEYAKTYSEKDDVFVKSLNKALEKAPKFSEPLTVFSGLSCETRDLVLAQNPEIGSKIHIGRALSTSVNPAQANGFMRGDNFVDGKIVEGKHVALEIIAEQGGVMSSVSRHQHEFEVLLPEASYEVVGFEENKELMWGEGRRGVTADLVIKLRQLS